MKSLMWFAACWVIVIAGYTSVFSQTVSDEARRHFDRGAAAVEMAKSPADYEAAIKEFKQAINLAPDWADAYYNLGKVQEQAEKFGDAIASLKEYLRLAPNATDAETVKSLINKLEYKAENTMTVPKVMEILARISTWEARGETTGPGFQRYIAVNGESSIRVPSNVVWSYHAHEPAVYRKVMTIAGPQVGFTYTEMLVEETGRVNQVWTRKVQLEVFSPTKVIVRVEGTQDATSAGGPFRKFPPENYELVPP